MVVSCALVAVMVGLLGCGGRVAAPQAAEGPQRLVRVDWYGSECFRIRTSLGLSIMTNPFAPGTTEYSFPSGLAADVLLVTDEDSSRNHVDGLENAPRVFRGSVGVGTNSAAGIRLLGVPVYADPDQPSPSSMSVMYRWISDNLRFGFIGDVPRMPDASDLARIGHVDVLFLSVGAQSLNAADRQEIVRALRPTVIIPMGPRSGISRFASGYTSVHRLNGPAALLSREAMPTQQTVLVFR